MEFLFLIIFIIITLACKSKFSLQCKSYSKYNNALLPRITWRACHVISKAAQVQSFTPGHLLVMDRFLKFSSLQPTKGFSFISGLIGNGGVILNTSYWFCSSVTTNTLRKLLYFNGNSLCFHGWKQCSVGKDAWESDTFI